MHYSGKKINIALKVSSFKRISPYVARYSGVVRAPDFLRGQKVDIKLTHYNAWQLRNARSEDQARLVVNRLGYGSLEQFERDVGDEFRSMSIKDSLVVFQGCLQSEDDANVWGCWVGEAVGVCPPNDAIYGYARLQSKPGRSGARVTADFLYADKATLIESIEDLKAFFGRYLAPSIDGAENNGNCLFRIRSKSSQKAVCFWVYVSRKDVCYIDDSGRERRFSIPDALEKTWEDAVVNGTQSSGLCRVVANALGADVLIDKEEHFALAREISDGIKSGEIAIEAIPGQRHRLIGEVLKHLNSSDSHLSRTMAVCNLDDGSGIGFYPMMGIIQRSVPSSVDHIEEQADTVVINRVFHEMDSKSVRADGIPFFF